MLPTPVPIFWRGRGRRRRAGKQPRLPERSSLSGSLKTLIRAPGRFQFGEGGAASRDARKAPPSAWPARSARRPGAALTSFVASSVQRNYKENTMTVSHVRKQSLRGARQLAQSHTDVGGLIPDLWVPKCTLSTSPCSGSGTVTLRGTFLSCVGSETESSSAPSES